MGYLEDLYKIFRGTTAGDKTGTPARTAGQGINENTDRINNALEEIDNASEKNENKTSVWTTLNDTLFPTIKNVNTQLEKRLPRGTNTTDTAQSLRDDIDGNTNNFQNYILLNEKGEPQGVATLDSNGKIPEGQIPDLAITGVITATQTTLTDFAANSGDYDFQQGDVIVIEYADDDERHFIYKGGAKSVTTNYSQISARKVLISQVEGLQGILDGLQAELNDIKTAADILEDTVAEAELDIIDLKQNKEEKTNKVSDLSNPSDETYLTTLGLKNNVLSSISGAGTDKGDALHIPMPEGGKTRHFYTNQEGAIKITLPVDINHSAIFSLHVDIFGRQYNTNPTDAALIHIVGQSNSSNAAEWSVTTLVSNVDLDYPIRFGNDGTNACIWIAEANHIFDYVGVGISNLFVGRVNTGSLEDWKAPFNITRTETFDTVDLLFENNLPVAKSTYGTDITTKLDKKPNIQNLWRGTQAQYDGITTKDENTIYFIEEE